MYCKNCKHWEGHLLRGENRIADCGKVNYNMPSQDKDTAFYLSVSADDDQGLSVSLATGENFGCIHFHPKNINS